MKQLIELKKFKRDKREVFVDFTTNTVTWKKKVFKIEYKNVGGELYPYVVLEEIKPKSEIIGLIKRINERKNKFELKYCEYYLNKNKYFVIGIGKDAIKAYKNNKEKPEYFRYSTTEGQRLLMKLNACLGQTLIL